MVRTKSTPSRLLSAKNRRQELPPPVREDVNGDTVVKETSLEERIGATRGRYSKERHSLCQLAEPVVDYQDVLVTCGCARERFEDVHRIVLEWVGGSEKFHYPFPLVLSRQLGGIFGSFCDSGVYVDSHCWASSVGGALSHTYDADRGGLPAANRVPCRELPDAMLPERPWGEYRST